MWVLSLGVKGTAKNDSAITTDERERHGKF